MAPAGEGAPLRLWCITDRKPGHLSQMRGLEQALAARRPLATQWFGCHQRLGELRAAGPAPDLVLVAGRRSHWLGLQVRYRLGGRLVVLLKPGFPLWLFDLCVIPRHDNPPQRANVVPTRGTINDVRPSEQADEARGLILVGGPSHNHDWSNATMLEQVAALKAALPGLRWTLSDSARSPADFLPRVRALADEAFTVVSHRDTDRPWLLAQLAHCGTVWVSEDSASMVYEALSAGARVGVLAVPRKRDSRVSRGLDGLLAEGQVSALDEVVARGAMPSRAGPLDEASRVAAHIDEWLRGT